MGVVILTIARYGSCIRIGVAAAVGTGHKLEKRRAGRIVSRQYWQSDLWPRDYNPNQR
jgi:hypothetical protein